MKSPAYRRPGLTGTNRIAAGLLHLARLPGGLRCRKKGRAMQGFSMVEVALALGIVAFALVSVMALLPMGLKTNQMSTEETRGANILTALNADLRNSLTNTGTSLIYGLPAPYVATSSTVQALAFGAPAVNVVNTKGLQEDEVAVAAAAGVRYQISVIYTKVPAAGSMQPMECRLIVNWPCLSPANSTPANLTNLSKVVGYVESYVTFPAP